MIIRWTIVLSWMMLLPCSFSSRAPDPGTITKHKDPKNAENIFHQNGVLPMEHQVSIFLYKNDSKRVVLFSEREGIPLSIAITPCSSLVIWSIYYTPFNYSATDIHERTLLYQFKSSELETYKTTSAKKGQYVIEMLALESETFLQVFCSAEPEPPHSARMAQQPRMRLQKRLRRKRLTVKWDQSLIDPHVTEYCLVVSTKRNYTSLCGARGDRWGAIGGEGPPPPKGPVKGGGRGRRTRPAPRSNVANVSKMGISSHGSETGSRQADGGDILISCVGSRTHHTVDNLEHGKLYYFNLFAVNRQTNLTFPYGSTVLQYDQRVKQSKLKDGKPESVNLKKLDGKAVFRFKAGKQTSDTLVVSVMPCGGAVDVEVSAAGGRSVLNRRRVQSYGRLTVPAIEKGQRYLITVLAANREELRRTDAVEILATTKEKLPLPELPSETEVREYESLRGCDSVTVGWLPSPNPSSIRYCVVAREIRKREMEIRAPDQCALERRLRKSADYHLMHCRDWVSPTDRNKVMTQRIPGLKPGRRYVVQVTVKKSGGKTLSYDLLTVHTKATCK